MTLTATQIAIKTVHFDTGNSAALERGVYLRLHRRLILSRSRGQIPLWFAVTLAGILFVAVAIWTWYSTRPETPDGRQEIVFWNASLMGTDIYTVLHQFETQHPQYRVIASSSVSININSDGQRLLSAVAGGVPPDLVYFDRFAIGEWASRGALTNLSPLLAKQANSDPNRIDLTDYYQYAVDEASFAPPGSKQPRQVYGIPTSTDVRLLYSNNDQLRQVGMVDAKGRPKPPKNWDELRAAATKLTVKTRDGVISRLGFAPNFGESWLYLYVFEAGGNLLDPTGTLVTLSSEPVVRALTFMTNVYDDLGGAQLVNGFQSSFQTGALDPFLQGSVSMKIDSDFRLDDIAQYRPNMDFSLSPPPLPADRIAAGAPPVTWSGGFSLVIPSTSREKDGAFLLTQFLMSEKTQRFLEQGKREAADAEGRMYLPHPGGNRKFFEKIEHEAIDLNPAVPPHIRAAFDTIKMMLPLTHIRPPSPIGQLLWNQHIRAYDSAVNHQYAGQFPTVDGEVRHALATMQTEAQNQLDAVIQPQPPHVVHWTGYFVGYAVLVALPMIGIYVAYQRNRRSHGYRKAEVGSAMLFLSPWIIGMICLTGGPIIFSIVLSFTRYDVLNPARYVGWQNYRDLFNDPVFYKSLINTGYMLIRVPLTMILSLLIAMMLNRRIRGIGAYRTAYYMPVIVPLVASALLWQFLLNPTFGPINVFLNWLFSTFPFRGIESLVNHLHTFAGGPFQFSAPAWLQDANWSKPALVLMGLWGAGGGIIIWLAGLQSIPGQLYEAATVDGANDWKQFWNVTVPMLSPYILFNAIIGVIGSMQIFSEAFIMTSGGPADSTLFYAYYLFKEAFQYFRMGYASALAWILFIIVLGLTLLQMWASKKWVHYDRT